MGWRVGDDGWSDVLEKAVQSIDLQLLNSFVHHANLRGHGHPRCRSTASQDEIGLHAASVGLLHAPMHGDMAHHLVLVDLVVEGQRCSVSVMEASSSSCVRFGGGGGGSFLPASSKKSS